MRRHTWIWAALAWVAVVMVVSTVTWAVIDSAGRNVLAQRGGATGGPAPTARQDPGAALSPPLVDESLATGTPPSPSTSSQSSARPPASTPPTTAPPLSPTGVTRTWQGTAGTVTVRCIGDRINLQAASPGDGWRVEVGEQGSEEVEVELTTEGEDDEGDEREVHIGARCVGGTPRFDVEQD